MSAVPQEAAFPLSTVDVTLCPQCAQQNPPEETYCVACGTALSDDPADPLLVPLVPLAAGTVLADLYLIESAEPHGRENCYHAVCQNEANGRVLLRERLSEDAEPLRVLIERAGGLTHPALLVPERLVEQDGRVYLVCPEVAGVKLADLLRQRGVERLCVGGLATDYCVKHTVLDGLKEGFRVVLLEDAVRGVDLQPGDSERAIAEMVRAGAEIARNF